MQRISNGSRSFPRTQTRIRTGFVLLSRLGQLEKLPLEAREAVRLLPKIETYGNLLMWSLLYHEPAGGG